MIAIKLFLMMKNVVVGWRDKMLKAKEMHKRSKQILKRNTEVKVLKTIAEIKNCIENAGDVFFIKIEVDTLALNDKKFIEFLESLEAWNYSVTLKNDEITIDWSEAT